MWQWLLSNWQGIIIALVAIETALARLFPDFGFLKPVDTDLRAIESAVGIKQP